MHENDGEDDPVDEAGYLGQFYRGDHKEKKEQLKRLRVMKEEEFVEMMVRENKLAEIVRTIKEIDK